VTRTLTVTPAQATALARLVEETRRAGQLAQDALALLTLGHDVPPAAQLTAIDADTGVLTFTDADG
jgi:hypothetical protein